MSSLIFSPVCSLKPEMEKTRFLGNKGNYWET